jgi:hypothetical protein
MCSGQVFANMTQYRANGRNCEAKRLHIEAYVACGCTHVGAARQHNEAVARTAMDPDFRIAGGRVSAQAGVLASHYGKLLSAEGAGPAGPQAIAAK